MKDFAIPILWIVAVFALLFFSNPKKEQLVSQASRRLNANGSGSLLQSFMQFGALTQLERSAECNDFLLFSSGRYSIGGVEYHSMGVLWLDYKAETRDRTHWFTPLFAVKNDGANMVKGLNTATDEALANVKNTPF